MNIWLASLRDAIVITFVFRWYAARPPANSCDSFGVVVIEVISAAAAYYHQSLNDYARRRCDAAGRDLAAYLAHRRTTATLRELAKPFGLSHPDSVSNLIRRAEQALSKSSRLKKDLVEIETRLLKTENRV